MPAACFSFGWHFSLLGHGLSWACGMCVSEVISRQECYAPVGTQNRTNQLRIVLNLAAYFPVLLFLIVGTGLGVALVSIGKILGPNKPDTEKNAPYECGFEAFEDARMKFDVRYYLVAILFIIFDLETAFLFPWGVALRDIGWPGFLSMMVFLLEFLLGFAYIWRKGGLDWE